MNEFKIPVLAPIRFYDPDLDLTNTSNFQNPDNRLSTEYDWENVKPVPYALPIPKEWPDGQDGIDTVVIRVDNAGFVDFTAKLYDVDDVYLKDCNLFKTYGI